MKTLVVYYSRTGTTKRLGEEIARLLKSDIEELIDLKNRMGIFGWIFSGRDAMKKYTTKIKEINKDIKKYDLVIIGTPNWGASLTPATRTFLEKYKRDIKKAAFFCTMGGDNPGKTFIQMEEIIQIKPIGTLALKAKEVTSGFSNDKIKYFLKTLK
jgi:flavodoxin